MPKLGKKHIANKINGKKGGYHLNVLNGVAHDQSDDNESDEDFVHGFQPRQADNSSSCFFMTIMMLQMVINAATSCDCNSPSYTIDVASYKGFNCNLEMICRCGNIKRMWAAPDNLDEACLLGCKLSGIQQGQIQDLLTVLNFGYENDKGNTYTVNIYGPRLRELSQNLDIKLDKMKTRDEKGFLDQILACSDTQSVHVSTDGMYPIRNNSGICLSSVMGSIDGEKKIICKL